MQGISIFILSSLLYSYTIGLLCFLVISVLKSISLILFLVQCNHLFSSLSIVKKNNKSASYFWSPLPFKDNLYIRGNRKKPSLVYLHKNDKYKIKEWEWAYDLIKDDMSLRSMCSDGFSKAFYESNK